MKNKNQKIAKRILDKIKDCQIVTRDIFLKDNNLTIEDFKNKKVTIKYIKK